MNEQRLDKWLWCARLFKTRALASDAIKAGRVRVNERRTKPSHAIRHGDSITVRRPPYEFELRVVGILAQRVPASRTHTLYEESESSQRRREQRQQMIAMNTGIDNIQRGKPSKRARRERERLKRSR